MLLDNVMDANSIVQDKHITAARLPLSASSPLPTTPKGPTTTGSLGNVVNSAKLTALC